MSKAKVSKQEVVERVARRRYRQQKALAKDEAMRKLLIKGKAEGKTVSEIVAEHRKKQQKKARDK